MGGVFVTGATGFVGERLVAQLRRQGVPVTALVRSASQRDRLAELGIKVVIGDLDSRDSLIAATQDVEVVFHVAAEMNIGQDPARHHRVNVEGFGNVLHAVSHSPRRPRVVLVSAAAICRDRTNRAGSGPSHPASATLTEPYARSKARAEELLRETPGIRAVVVRPGLVWGEGDRNFLPALAQAVQAGHFTWVEHGAYPYSTVHVDRLVDGLIVAAERGVDGGVYYVTDGPPQSSRAFCDARLQEAGVRASDRSVPRWLARGGGVDPIWWTDFYAASCSLAAASKHAGLM